ncbi:hypothetical protein AAIR98_000866 [Elusimicrobium simillimum]|uniref:hypothetical protein n=1 Tax=Elusimicrobium simillimum TaxID=3143438 RepID=UPI003C703D76
MSKTIIKNVGPWATQAEVLTAFMFGVAELLEINLTIQQTPCDPVGSWKLILKKEGFIK